MTRTISVSEAKNTLSAVLEWAVENDDGIVIQISPSKNRHGGRQL